MRDVLEAIRATIGGRNYRFTLHAADRMIERHISTGEIEEALLSREAEVIEDYANDPRGASRLILGMTKALAHSTCIASTHPMSP